MHAEDASVQCRNVLIGDGVRVPSRPARTWPRLASILGEVGSLASLASLAMVLASCGGGATMGTIGWRSYRGDRRGGHSTYCPNTPLIEDECIEVVRT